MKAIEIKVPDEFLGFPGSVEGKREKFVLKAIEEKINREKKRNFLALLVEGYRATAADRFKNCSGIRGSRF